MAVTVNTIFFLKKIKKKLTIKDFYDRGSEFISRSSLKHLLGYFSAKVQVSCFFSWTHSRRRK